MNQLQHVFSNKFQLLVIFLSCITIFCTENWFKNNDFISNIQNSHYKYDQYDISSSKCNIKFLNNPSEEEFLKTVREEVPVVLINVTNNSLFQKVCDLDKILYHYGSHKVVLSSSNSYSYEKKVCSLAEYVDKYMKKQTLDSKANETWYQFGDNYMPGELNSLKARH